MPFPGTITLVKTLGERVRYARERRELTQQELAKRAGCTQGAIGNVETGERQSLRNLVSVARALHVSTDWLFDGHGPEPDWEQGGIQWMVREPDVPYLVEPPAWPFVTIKPQDLPPAGTALLAEIERSIRMLLSLQAEAHQRKPGTGTAP